MSVHPARKVLYLAAVTAFIVVFCGYTPAGAFNNEPIELPGLRLSLLMAQQTQESTDEQSETPREEVPDQAEQEEDDEYDDDEYDDDEYADDDVDLISDPLIQGNTDFYNFNDTMYFWLLKPVSRGYGFIIPEELRMAVRNVFYNIRFPVRFINCLLQGKGIF